MITIDKSITNTVVMTLTEKSSLANPNYLFRFINDSSKVETLFNMEDQSGYQRRYNLFELVETSGATDPSIGEVTLDYGFGTYEVYESATPTLIISATTGTILEEGKTFVNGYPSNFQSSTNLNTVYL
jgi:hypothetical protein